MNFKRIFNKIEFYNYSILLVSIFPLLGLKKTVYAIFIFSVLSIYVFVTERNYKNFHMVDFKNIFVLSSYFLALLLSFFISLDNPVSLKLLEQNISFIIFPLFLIINKNSINKKTFENSLNTFVVSNVVLAIYVWFNIYKYGLLLAFEENTYYKPILRNFFSDLTGIHLPYIGLLFIFSSLIMMNVLLKLERKFIVHKTIIISIILILVGSVFAFAARQSLFLFFIISAFLILFHYKSTKKRIAYLTIFILLLIPFFTLPSIQNRIKELKETKLILPTAGQNSSDVNFRYGIYSCTWKLLKQNWIFGVGPTNVQKELDNCYSVYTYRNQYDDFNKKTYNTHNQYFDILLKFGIFGFLGFMIYIFWGIKHKSEYYYIFIVLSILSMLTENILNRQVGIVFFNFFNSLFFVQYLKIKTDIKDNLEYKK